MESVIFKQDFIDSVLEDVKDFIDSEGWYEEMGIPYKRSYLLFGPPGTGKSSFAQALAGQIMFSICYVNCSDRINDFQFQVGQKGDSFVYKEFPFPHTIPHYQ